MSSLDIGCGYAETHVKKGEIGVDIKRGFCDVQASAYFLPFRGGCFRQVVMSHVLEHLMNCVDALREACRVLAEEGKLVVEVPNPYDFNVIKDTLMRRRVQTSSEHIFSFDENELRNLLRKVGLGVTKVEYVNSYWTEVKLRETGVFKRVLFALVWRVYPQLRTAIRVESRLKG